MAYEPISTASKPDVYRRISSSGVAECLVDSNRRLVRHGLGKTDDPQHISTRLCKDACDRAFALKVVYHQKKDSDDLVNVREGIGQVGFLRGSRIPTSPGSGVHYAAIPVTAKHNLRKIENQDHELYPADAIHSSFFFKSDLSERLLAFDDLNVSVVNQSLVLRECSLSLAEWSFGIDISVGRTVSNRSDGVTNDRYSWELAGRSYEFKKDQKVGLAVFNTVQHRSTHCKKREPRSERPTGANTRRALGNIWTGNGNKGLRWADHVCW